MDYKFGNKIKVRVDEKSKWYVRVFVAYDEERDVVFVVDPKHLYQYNDGNAFTVEKWSHHDKICEDDFEITIDIKTTKIEKDGMVKENSNTKVIKRDVYNKILDLL